MPPLQPDAGAGVPHHVCAPAGSAELEAAALSREEEGSHDIHPPPAVNMLVTEHGVDG